MEICSPSFSNGNGNVIGDLLLLRNANDKGGAVEDDNAATAAAAAAFPTHHTIIVPAPMDVRRDRNSRSGRVVPACQASILCNMFHLSIQLGNHDRSKFLDTSDEDDESGRDVAAADDNDNEKRGGGSSSRDLATSNCVLI